MPKSALFHPLSKPSPFLLKETGKGVAD